MSGYFSPSALIVVGLVAAALPATAGTTTLSGTRSNISPGGLPGLRCAPAITVSFAPDALAASGTSNLGNFSYIASHCIAGMPPGPYSDGLWEWTFAGGTLSGTHDGLLTATMVPFQFNVLETLLVTGGSGVFAGATGMLTATGTVTFGELDGNFVSFGEANFRGEVTAAGIPEPATWAMLVAGFGAVGVASRRRCKAYA